MKTGKSEIAIGLKIMAIYVFSYFRTEQKFKNHDTLCSLE